MSDGMIAETTRIKGYKGEEIEAYLARPTSDTPIGGVVVIHHMPGYDEGSKEITRTFAAHGYAAICPNLHYHQAPDIAPDDAAAAVRADGGVPDEQLIGDVEGSADALRGLTSSNGKVATIGYCSGGRQSFLAACNLPLDAAIVCYGAFIAAKPAEGFPLQVEPIIGQAKNLSCPVLGLFGAEDQYPGRVGCRTQQTIKATRIPHIRERGSRILCNRSCELSSGSGGGRLEAHLGFSRPQSFGKVGDTQMCTYITNKVAIEGSAKGSNGWFKANDGSVYFDHPQHAQAEHTLNIDFLNPSLGPSARVAVELTAESAYALAQTIMQTLREVPPGLIPADLVAG
jgi:carboxymethylenebutenolidase